MVNKNCKLWFYSKTGRTVAVQNLRQSWRTLGENKNSLEIQHNGQEFSTIPERREDVSKRFNTWFKPQPGSALGQVWTQWKITAKVEQRTKDEKERKIMRGSTTYEWFCLFIVAIVVVLCCLHCASKNNIMHSQKRSQRREKGDSTPIRHCNWHDTYHWCRQWCRALRLLLTSISVPYVVIRSVDLDSAF